MLSRQNQTNLSFEDELIDVNKYLPGIKSDKSFVFPIVSMSVFRKVRIVYPSACLLVRQYE